MESLQQIAISTSILSTVATVVIAALATLFFWTSLRDKSKSRYDEERHKAVLSEMRSSYEAQIRDLVTSLTATEERWKDLNHLLISSQKNQTQPDTGEKVHLSKFLQGVGITENDLAIDRKLVLVLMPFHPAYDELYKTVVAICRRAGLNCVRGDEERSPGDILSHILKLMAKSRLVLADITERNPNVFYELGMAHLMDKPTILIARQKTKIPFNVQSMRIFLYTDYRMLERNLAEIILRALA